MSLHLVAGTTSKSIGIFIGDSSVTTGAGLTGLVFNTANLVAYYFQPRITGATAITLATLASATAAWSSGGFKEIDATNMPGWYRLDIPDAALTGATSVLLGLKGATNMRPVQVEIELTAVNNQDAVRFGMTALPNAAAAASGGLLINGTNTTATVVIGSLSVLNNSTFGANLTVTGTFTVTGGSTLNLANNTITAASIASDAITAAKIATGAFTAAKFAAGAFDAVRTSIGMAAADLDTQLDNILGTGAGSFPITVTVVDGSAVAIQNALVWISDGVTAIQQQTNASGQATYSLNAATYTVGITKAGYSFTPTTRTVTGSQAGTLVNNLVMTAVNVPPSPPANPAKGTIYGNIVRSDGASPAGIAITATLSNSSGRAMAFSVGNMLVAVVQSTTTDGNGDWEIDLFGNDDITPAGSYWVVEIAAANFSANVELDGGEVLNVDDLII